MFQDLKLFVRESLKRPVWTLSIVLVLALGIAANSAMYTGFHAWVVRPLPFREPQELVQVTEAHAASAVLDADLSAADYEDLSERQASFEAVGAFTRIRLIADDGVEPVRLDGARISASLFPMLGIEPMLGRNFTAEDDLPGQPAPFVLIGYRLWQERFAGAPDVLGRTLRLDGREHEIVGVMPEGFRFPEWGDVWTPLGLLPSAEPRDRRYLDVIARLRPGSTLESANAELAVIAAELARLHPESNRGFGISAEPLRKLWVPDVIELALAASLGAGLLVILVICANVASLLLTRATGRRREMALRAALGAARSRLVRQTLLESTVLALAGGLLGGLLGRLWSQGMLARVPSDPPYAFAMELDAAGWTYTFAIALLAGAICAVGPVLNAGGARIYDELRSGGRGGTSRTAGRWRSFLVVAELGLTTALVIGALMMVKSFVMQQRLETGYRSRGVAVMELSLQGPDFEAADSRRDYLERLAPRLAAVSGVARVTFTSQLPSDGFVAAGLEAEGRPLEDGESLRAALFGIADGYLETYEIPLYSGRTFSSQELRQGEPVAIVSRSLALELWQEEDVVGRRLRLRRDGWGPWHTVIGVVGDIRGAHDMVATEDVPNRQIYLPYAARQSPAVTLVVRSDRALAALGPELRRVIRAEGTPVPATELLTMNQALQRGQWVTRLFSEELATYALMALVIAVIGVYGLVADSVSRRHQEIALRMAMGAGRREVLALVVRQGARLALLGGGAGIVLGLLGASAAAAMMRDVNPRDPVIVVGVVLLLGLATLVASYLPARRAAGIDPSVMLRAE